MLGNLRFEPDAVPFVFAPQPDHHDVRRLWSQVLNTRPLPVLLDAKWPLPLIQEVAEREDL